MNKVNLDLNISGQYIKLDSKGRISIPATVRKKLDLRAGDMFETMLGGEGIVVYRLVERAK